MLSYLLRFVDRDRFQGIVAFLEEGPFVDEVRGLGVEVIQLPAAPRLRELWRWGEAVDALADIIDQVDPDVVLANGEKMSVFASRAARTKGVPCVAWLHDAPGANGMSGRLAQRALRRGRPDAVITCSKWLADEFEARLGLGARAIVNGIDLDGLPRAHPAMARLKQELGWPADSLVVGHFTRLQRWKGTDVFVETAARCMQDPRCREGVRFLIVGGALYGREVGFQHELERLIEQRGLAGVVEMAGYRSDALELMAGTDIVVHASISPDPFPTVVLESMALGVPIVATKTRGPEEAIEHGVDGILVEPGDPDAAAEQIAMLIGDAERRGKMGAIAAAKSLERFDARRMAAEFETLLCSLAERKTVVSS